MLILGIAGKRLDLLHLLFGSALAVDGSTLTGMLWVSGLSLIAMTLIYKPLLLDTCLLYTSPSPRDGLLSRMPSSA